MVQPPTLVAGLPSYAFSYIDYPQSPDTYVEGINSGAASSKMEIVGAYGPELEEGFLLQLEGKEGTTYAFKTVAHPKSSSQSPLGINDFGQIVGTYVNSSGTTEGYEFSGGKFTTIAVPFTGATYTEAQDINNSGEIVGEWGDPSGVDQGFTLIEGTYTSFDYPGAPYTLATALNNLGAIVGYYEDSEGNFHGFLLSGGTYTSIDVPGAVGTLASGNNDAGDVVGLYCTASECLTENGTGEQGFLLSGGVFTTVNVPGASNTQLLDINNNGVIVGVYTDSRGGYHSFIAFP